MFICVQHIQRQERHRLSSLESLSIFLQQTLEWESLESLSRCSQSEDGVRDDGVASLIVVARERRGSFGVGFENMKRSWVMN